MTKKLWNKILACFDGVKDDDLSYSLKSIKDITENKLLFFELGEKLGVPIPEYHIGTDFIQLTSEISLILWDDAYKREISCPDDGEQPENGWWLVISFPAGPYILHRDYPQHAFRGFFDELKAYGPKHVDTINGSLYFSLDFDPQPARDVYHNYSQIYKKWCEAAQKEVLEDQIRKAEDVLQKLKGKQ